MNPLRLLLLHVPAVVLLAGCNANDESAAIRVGKVEVAFTESTSPITLSSEIRASPIVVAEFPIRNVGTREARITFEGVSCSCLTARSGGTVLEERDVVIVDGGQPSSIELAMRLDPNSGLWSQSATLLISDSIVEKRVYLRMSVPVVADVSASPNVLSHGFTSPRPNARRTISIERTYRGQDQQSRTPQVTGLPNCVEVKTIEGGQGAESVEPGLWTETWDLQFDLAGCFPARPAIQSDVTVAFGDSESEMLRIPILIRNQHGIIAPETVHFGIVNAGSDRTRRLVIASTDQCEFEVRNIEVDNPELQAECQSAAKQVRHLFELRFRPTTSGTFSNILEISTSHPTTPVVRIGVKANVPEPDGTES